MTEVAALDRAVRVVEWAMREAPEATLAGYRDDLLVVLDAARAELGHRSAAAADPIRVLITGSREFTDRPIMAAAINTVRAEHPGRLLTIVHGAARGADSLAAAICRDHPDKLIEEAHPVTDWTRPDGSKDRAAGHRRNQRMVNLGATVCLAFLDARSENRGTRSCMEKAKAAGIEVRAHWGGGVKNEPHD